MAGNREYKSDVFSMLLEDKKNALQVYNALNQTAYEDPNLIEVHTLNKGVSLSVRNDAFECPIDTPQLELTCKIYNINHGNNKEFLDKCPVLQEYMIFVDYVRSYHAKDTCNSLEDAINQAIDRCIQEDVLREFLKNNRSEVVKVMQMDYTFERQIELEREASRRAGHAEGLAAGHAEGHAEGLAAGHAEGLKSGKRNALLELVRDGLLSSAEAAERLSMTEDDIIRMINV